MLTRSPASGLSTARAPAAVLAAQARPCVGAHAPGIASSSGRGIDRLVACRSSQRIKEEVDTSSDPKPEVRKQRPQPAHQDNRGGLGDLLGPIGLTLGGELKAPGTSQAGKPLKPKTEVSNDSGLALGPIGLSFGSELGDGPPGGSDGAAATGAPLGESIHEMTTEEWRARYEADGTVDLWLEEEFNAGSRLMGGRAVHKGGVYGINTGEGPSVSNAPRHKIKIFNHYADQEIDVEVPEDRYILWEAEDEGLELPYACRMGCCTACAVRIKEGTMYQPEALGISAELREQGYGLMCVGYPMSDCVLETVPEDEVYELQFGASFSLQAIDPSNPEYIERDDFALEIANMDE